MKDFDAVVFDMDGVIFDSERVLLLCWKEMEEKYGIDDIEEVYLKCTGTNYAKTKQIVLDAYGEGFPYEECAGEASRLFHERYDGGRLPMKSGVREILGFLKKSEKKVALASSSRRQPVLDELGAAGILDYFDEVITGDMVERSKPEPDIFLLACEKLGVTPEKAYAIEDSYNGITAAYRGGLRPIMVPDLLPANEEMRGMTEAVFDCLEEVVAYLRETEV